GLLKDGRAVAPLAALTRTGDGAPQCEAVTAIAKIGGDEGARAVADLLDVKTAPGVGTSAVQRVALLEAWRLGTRAPVARLTDFARDPDPAARAHAVYSLAHLRLARAVPALLGALADAESYVRAVALRGVTRAVSDSAQIAPPEVIARIRPLLGDRDGHVRVNALRALASFQDSTLVGLALPLTDPDGRGVAQALQALGRIVAEGDTSLAPRARALLAHPDAAVRSVAADLLARHPAPADVDALATAYERAATDTFDDARL